MMTDELETLIENGYSEIMRALYRMRQAKDYQREYDTMGTLISCLMQDRDHLRKTYPVKP